jgi:hypothetical protein
VVSPVADFYVHDKDCAMGGMEDDVPCSICGLIANVRADTHADLRDAVEALPTDRVTVLENGAQIHVARESLEAFKADVLDLLT